MKQTLLSLILILWFAQNHAFCLVITQDPSNHLGSQDIESLLLQSQSYKISEPLKSLEISQSALKLSRQNQNPSVSCKCLNQIGTIWLALAELDSAKFYFDLAVYIGTQQGHEHLLPATWINLGHYFEIKAQYDSSFYYLQKALLWGEQHKDTSVIIKSHISLGEISRTQNNLIDAKNYLQIARALALQTNDQTNLAYANQNLGIVLDQMELPDSSLYYNAQALEYFKSTGNIKGVADCLLNSGVVLEWTGKTDEAIAHYDEAGKYYSQLEDLRGKATANLNLAALKFYMGEKDLALSIAQKVIELAKSKGIMQIEELAYSNIHEWYAETDMFKEAYAALQKSDSIHQLIQNSEKIKTIQTLQTKYDTFQKENQIAQQNQLIEKQKLRNNIALLLLLLVIGIAIILILSFRVKVINARKEAIMKSQKLEEMLNDQEVKTYNALLDGQENELKRIATELHDRLGHLLVTAQLQLKSLTPNPVADSKNPETGAKLLDEALDEVRRISRNLNSGSIDNFGLATSIQEMAFNINSSKLLLCHFQTNCEGERFNSSIEIAFYRIAQEIVTNAIKYSKASVVHIQLNLLDGELNLSVEDNGIGFDPNKAEAGLGLKNIYKRASTIGAEFAVDSSPGHGTAAQISVKVREIPSKKSQV